MPFAIADNEENAFFKELDEAPDRIVGLCATVIVEKRLEYAIKRRWQDSEISPKHTIFKELFREGAELGNFGTQIKIGHAMGLYGADGYNDLRLLSKIRNAFAHRLSVKQFDAQPVVDFIKNLKLPNKYPLMTEDQIIAAIATSGDNWVVLERSSKIKDIQSPRSKFLRTIELLTVLLLKTDQQHLFLKSPPPF